MSEQHDPVNPPHYKTGKVECIDAIEASLGKDGFRAFLRGQVLKYVWRCVHKGMEETDLKKAQWYLDRLIKTFDHCAEGQRTTAQD